MYRKPVFANAIAELTELKFKFSDALTKYLSSSKDSEMFLCHAHGKTFGKTTSQLAEVGNKTLEEFRMMPIVSGLLRLIEQEHERLMTTMKKAISNKCVVTPKIQNDLLEKQKIIDCLEKRTVEIHSLFTKVFSIGQEKKGTWHCVKIDTSSCTCGETEVSTKPCQHLIICAKHHRIDPETLYGVHHTGKKWLEQYQALGDFKLVSMANVKAYSKGELKAPRAFNASRGRPKSKKRCISNIEKWTFKQK